MNELKPGRPLALTMFSYAVPFPAGTKKIEIINRVSGRVLLSRKVSSHAPTVLLMDAKGGFTAKFGTKLKLKWRADDKDLKSISGRAARAKKLRHSVLIRDEEADAAAGWRALAMNISDRQYNIDTKLPSHSTYQVKVMTTDGVNTGTNRIARLRVRGTKVR